MRINQFLARYTDLSRRAADEAVAEGRVEINGNLARLGDIVVEKDVVTLDRRPVKPDAPTTVIIFHKPAGCVVSREGQGNRTIYDILPEEYHRLNPVGRLDKDSSGLLLLTNDGELANRLTHPRFGKEKIYEVELDKPLEVHDQDAIHHKGIALEDGISRLSLSPLDDTHKLWQVRMSEGRNRQIRRTFGTLGYEVAGLHRTQFGDYELGKLEEGEYLLITT